MVHFIRLLFAGRHLVCRFLLT
jgi:hypothetical protein